MKSLIFSTLRVAMPLFCIFLSFGIFESRAQNTSIRISATEGAGKPISISPPVAGRYFLAARYTDTLDAQGRIVINCTQEVPGLFIFAYEKKFYWLYVKPGELVELLIDKSNKERPLTMLAGSFPKAQESMNRLELGLEWAGARVAGDQYYTVDPEFERTREKVMDEVGRQLAPFDELYRLQQMDVGFYETVQLLVNNHYAEVLCHALVNEVASLIYHPDSAGYDQKKINQVRKNWESIFALADYRDSTSIRVPTYAGYFHLGYAQTVQDWYVDYFLPKSEGRKLSPGKKTMADYFQNSYWQIRDHHSPGPLQEYLFASQIHFINSRQNYYDFIPDLYTDFISRYPNSIYIPYLKPAVDEVIAFHRKIQREKDGDYRFVDNREAVADFEGLMMQHFPDQTVYVDLWATWCVPCKEEFRFSDSLHQFVASRDISVLYISIDKDHDEKKWEEMIAYYDLKGHHIRASESLIADIRKLIFHNNAITIPRYILVKNGKIIEDNMMRPSARNLLYDQINKLVSID